jgi:MoxR-like ATPase
MQINCQQLTSILKKTVPASLPTLTFGAPGIGKSDLHAQAAQSVDYDYLALYPALLDPTDLAGMPIPVANADGSRSLHRLLDDLMARIFDATKPLLVLLDEIGQASPAMQAACAPLLLSRTVGKHRLPDHVTVCAATNRRQDRAGASSILTHLISRMACVVELTADLDSWTGWALRHDMRPEVISFIRWRPKLLHDFDAEKASAGTEPYPCPRSWSNLSKLLDLNLDEEAEALAFAGCVGQGAASEFSSHLRLARELPDLDQILLDPSKLRVPTQASTLFALASGVAARCNEQTVENVLDVAAVLHKKKAAEYAMLLVRDSVVKFPGIASTPAWKRRTDSDLFRAITDV